MQRKFIKPGKECEHRITEHVSRKRWEHICEDSATNASPFSGRPNIEILIESDGTKSFDKVIHPEDIVLSIIARNPKSEVDKAAASTFCDGKRTKGKRLWAWNLQLQTSMDSRQPPAFNSVATSTVQRLKLSSRLKRVQWGFQSQAGTGPSPTRPC